MAPEASSRDLLQRVMACSSAGPRRALAWAAMKAGTSALYLRIEKGDYVGWIRFLMPPSRAGGPEVAISGNPFWGALICGYDGIRTTRCLDGINARRLLRGGRITGFRFGNR